MPKKLEIDYEQLFTHRKDGRYQKVVKGKTLIDRDPEKLLQRVRKAEDPIPEKVQTFKEIAEAWEGEHREEITERTWKNYKPHFDDIIAIHGKSPIDSVGAIDVIRDLQSSKAKGCSATIISTRRSIYRMIMDYAVVKNAIPYN